MDGPGPTESAVGAGEGGMVRESPLIDYFLQGGAFGYG
jgi:hypothetical protein